MHKFLAFLVFCLISPAILAQEITIDGSKRYQTIDGFGTCLAWWKDQPYDDPKFQSMYWRDLGASILRMEFHPNALTSNGKLDGPPIVLGENIDDNIKLFNFSAKGVKNFGQMAKAGKAMKIDEFKLIGSLWTPPHWMKTGATINKDGQSCAGSLKMDPENLQQFARYIAAFVKGFEQTYGVPVYAISIQNELRFKEPYNSCIYTPNEYAAAFAAVAKEFARCNLSTKLMGPEDVGVGEPGNSSFIANQMSFINALKKNDDAWKALSIFCIHGYAGDGASPIAGVGENWAKYWSEIKDYGKPSWQTETSGQASNWRKEGKNGDRGALSIALAANDALTDGNVSAWVYWQTAMDKTGKIKPEALTVGADNTSKKLAAARHFFRLIRPGAVRVDTSAIEGQPLHASAFVHEKNKTIVIQLINMGAGNTSPVLRLTNLSGVKSLSTVRTTEQETFEPRGQINVVHDSATIELPAYSIVTLSGKIE
jgi:O-glycosyl hydrolase